MLWFTADPHLGHANILKFCDRPFKNIHEHDQAFLDNWNQCLTDDDDGFIIGDLAFRCSPGYFLDILRQMNGRIHLIFGNHDHKIIKGTILRHSKFVQPTHMYYHELPVEDPEMGNHMIVLMHYPIENWNKKHFGTWHLHGHSHGHTYTPPHVARMDVGVDVCNFYPVSYEAIKNIFTQRMLEGN